MQWTGLQAVVTLPQHIDSSNTDQIREQLLWIINRGAAVLIGDLTGTISCDYSGADALARAHHRATANGAELRLVVTAEVIRRALTVNGLDRLVAVYPDLDAAVAAGAGRREHRTPTADPTARTGERLDMAVANIFDVGLILQAAIDLPPGVTARRITEALRRLDDAVRDIRDHVFAGRGQNADPGLARRPPRTSWNVRRRPGPARSCCEGTRRKRRKPCSPPRPAPQRCWNGGLTFSASQGASTIQPRSRSGRPLPIRQGRLPSAGSSRRNRQPRVAVSRCPGPRLRGLPGAVTAPCPAQALPRTDSCRT